MIADPVTAKPVPDLVLQNAVKQRTPFIFTASTIFLNQFEHRLLDDIEGIVITAGGDARLEKCAPLNTGEKPVQCLASVQCLLPVSSYLGIDIPYAHVFAK